MAAGRVLLVIGAKGGVGATAVAANLGAALAAREETLLLTVPGEAGADLALWFPAAMAPPAGEELRGGLASLTPELLESLTGAGGDRLRLLVPDADGGWSAGEVRRLLRLSRGRYPFVVADAGGWRGGALPGALSGAAAEAALILIVATPDPLALRRARELAERFKPAERPVRALVNRAAGRQGAGVVEALGGLDVVGSLAEARELAEALLAGTPLARDGARGPLALELRRVADLLPGWEPAPETALPAAEPVAPRRTAPAVTAPDAIHVPPAPARSRDGADDPFRTPAFRALKRRLHRAFLDRMRERGMTPGDPETVRVELAGLLAAERMGDVTAGFRDRLLKELIDGVLGLGSLQDLLDDPAVTEVMVNGPEDIWVERAGKLAKVDRTLDGEEELRGIIERIVAPLGRRIDESSPLVDARLADGSRVNAIIPPLALRGSTLTIRKFAKKRLTADHLVEGGSLTPAAARFLHACVAGRLNILISGGTGSGKTTLLNILSSFIGSDERIVTIEDAAELQLPQPHVVPLESRPPNLEGKGAVTIRDLVKNALRMRPDRIVIGECRGGEALDMLQAMNTGHDGSLSTLHANTPRDGLSRLETMCLMAGMDLPLRAIREQAAGAVDLVVQIARQRDGGRRVTHITELCGMEGEVFRLQDIFVRKAEGPLQPAGLVPRCAERLADRGQPVDPALFTGG